MPKLVQLSRCSAVRSTEIVKASRICWRNSRRHSPNARRTSSSASSSSRLTKICSLSNRQEKAMFSAVSRRRENSTNRSEKPNERTDRFYLPSTSRSSFQLPINVRCISALPLAVYPRWHSCRSVSVRVRSLRTIRPTVPRASGCSFCTKDRERKRIGSVDRHRELTPLA